MVTWPSASSTTLPSLRTHKTVVPCIAPLLCALFWLIGIPPLYAAPGKAQKPRTLVLLYLLIRISSEVFMPRRSASLRLIVCFFLFAISTFAYSAAPTADSWNRLSDDFVDQYLAFSPTASTQVGIHIHDAKLDDYSPASIAKQIAWLQQFEKRVLAFDAKMLSATDAADREILLNNIRANLLELQVIRTFAKNPDNYSSGAAASIYVIMSRKFAPADERLRSVIAREKQFPRRSIACSKSAWPISAKTSPNSSVSPKKSTPPNHRPKFSPNCGPCIPYLAKSCRAFAIPLTG